MTFYVKSGTIFSVTKDANMDIRSELPPGNYTIGITPQGEWYLDSIDDFEIPSKLYGNAESLAKRILSTYEDRGVSTGVLLAGEKGSGKSMTVKLVSVLAAKEGIPTIVVGTAFHGEAFNRFIQSIEQPCIVLFDEADKVYHEKDKQQALLTLLDGVFPAKKLFLLTVNDKFSLSQYMNNRPGRILYSIDYLGVPVAEIEKYCKENLNDKSQIAGVQELASLFYAFNFDMMKALVEEMNRYKESASEASILLNTKPGVGVEGKYDVSITLTKEKVTRTRPTIWEGSPLSDSGTSIYGYYETKDEDGDVDENYHYFDINQSALTKIDKLESSFEFTYPEGVVKLTKCKTPEVEFGKRYAHLMV